MSFRFLAPLLALALTAPLAPPLAPPALAREADGGLRVSYPDPQHRTSAESIFFIGTAPAAQPVTLNGRLLARSRDGHFGPTVPLALGENVFLLTSGGRTLRFVITRASAQGAPPAGPELQANSAWPAFDTIRETGESVTLEAVAGPDAQVEAVVGARRVTLAPQPGSFYLPVNSAGLIERNAPIPLAPWVRYAAELKLARAGEVGPIRYEIRRAGRTAAVPSAGKLRVVEPGTLGVVMVTADAGVTRSGPSTDHSRLSPLPRGARAAVTGAEGGFWRLRDGRWLKQSETRPLPGAVGPRSLLRSVRSQTRDGFTEVVFPLQEAVPFRLEEGAGTLELTLEDTVAQTDLYRCDPDAILRTLTWRQAGPTSLRYTFQLKTPQAWGYTARYEGTSLVVSLRHPPSARRVVLLDPGHGGADDPGTASPTGVPEKDMTLAVSRRVRDALRRRGVEVVMTREDDRSLGLVERQALIERTAPTLALSLHYNALPDGGDVASHQGIGAFWYHPQAQDLAASLHRALTTRGRRPSYGVFWDNLALARPTAAPSVLMELGFLIHPEEYEWIADGPQQAAFAETLAEAIVEWIARRGAERT